MTNWKAMQIPKDKKTGKFTPPSDVRPRYMAMGSWHASASNGGVRKPKGGGK